MSGRAVSGAGEQEFRRSTEARPLLGVGSRRAAPPGGAALANDRESRTAGTVGGVGLYAVSSNSAAIAVQEERERLPVESRKRLRLGGIDAPLAGLALETRDCGRLKCVATAACVSSAAWRAGRSLAGTVGCGSISERRPVSGKAGGRK